MSQYFEDEADSRDFREALYSKTAPTFWTTLAMWNLGLLIVATPFVMSALGPSASAVALSILLRFFIVESVLFPLCWFITEIRIRQLRQANGTITLDERTVRLSHRFQGDSCYCSADLSECRWFYGSRAWATVPWREHALGPWFEGKSLLLVFPERCRTDDRFVQTKRGKRLMYPPGPVIVSVGNTPESKTHWEEVFFRLGMERAEDLENRPAPIGEGFARTALIFIIPSAFLVSKCLADVLQTTAYRNGFPEDIVGGIRFATIVAGTYLGFFSLVAWLFLRRRDQPIKRSEPLLNHSGDVLKLGAFLLIFLAVVWFFGNDLSWTYRTTIIVSASLFLVGIGSGLVFLQCAASPEKTATDPPDGHDSALHDDLDRYSGHFKSDSY